MADIGTFAGIGLALYAAHHVGDYWIQTDHQAAHKGKAGNEGRRACLFHVATYVITQAVFLAAVLAVTGAEVNTFAGMAALLFSGVTHYLADRREFGIMFRIARMFPGKENFLRLGVPRANVRLVAHDEDGWGGAPELVGDNPSLGTGGWALDQSWHIALGVFVPALIACL